MATNVYIEADSITVEKMSGIGHTALEIIKALDAYAGTNKKYNFFIIIPLIKKEFISRYKFKNISIKYMPRGYRYINYILTRTPLLVPVDIWFGRGVYIFPNYKNWYVPFSKSITFVHDVVFKAHPDTLHPKNRAYLEDSFNRWLKRTDKIISISKSSADELTKYYPKYKDKVNVIYLGVDTSVYYPRTKQEVDGVRSTYSLPENYFLYVGNIEPRKNILNLLEAYKLYADIHKKNPASLVLISGSGWNSEDIYRRLYELQAEGYSIIIPGKYVQDKDLPAIYTQAKALVHIAIHEGFGLPPLQALACKTKVIASDIPVLIETMERSRALFVDPYNIKAVSRAFADIDKYEPSANHRENFTWNKTVQDLLRLVDTI